MKVQIRKGFSLAGPNGAAREGQVIDVGLDEAKGLIAGGYADYVKSGSPAPVAPVAATPPPGASEQGVKLSDLEPAAPVTSTAPVAGPQQGNPGAKDWMTPAGHKGKK